MMVGEIILKKIRLVNFLHSKIKLYSEKDIINQLNQCARDFTFPMLDNGYVYPVESRMTIYRDDFRWAIIIEIVGFSYRGGGHDGISNCLHVFGNCIDFAPGTHNDNFVYFMDDSDEGNAFDQEYFDRLNPAVKTTLLRDEKIQTNHDPNYYEQLGIKLEEPPQIMIWEFLRGLIPNYRSKMLATEAELRARIPQDIPEFMQLNEWNHVDLAEGQQPGESETFQMIAQSIVSGKTTHYRPTLQPNNHWVNWPEGGIL